MAKKYGGAPAPAADEAAPRKDFMSAMEELPDEMEAPAEGSDGAEGLDAEQTALAEQMGMSPSEAAALKKFIESC